MNANHAKRKTKLAGDTKKGCELLEEGSSPSAFGGGGGDGADSSTTTERSGDTHKIEPQNLSMRPGSLAIQAATRFAATLQKCGVSSPDGQNAKRHMLVDGGKGGGTTAREKRGLAALAPQGEKGSGPETSDQDSRDSYEGETYNPWSLSDVIQKAVGEADALSVSRACQGEFGTPPPRWSLGGRVLLPRSNVKLVEPSKATARIYTNACRSPGMAPRGRVVPTIGFEGESLATSFDGAQLEHGSGNVLGPAVA